MERNGTVIELIRWCWAPVFNHKATQKGGKDVALGGTRVKLPPWARHNTARFRDISLQDCLNPASKLLFTHKHFKAGLKPLNVKQLVDEESQTKQLKARLRVVTHWELSHLVLLMQLLRLCLHYQQLG